MPNPFDTGIRLTVVAPTEGRTRCDVDEFVLCPTNARADEWQRLAETEAREHLATRKLLVEAEAALAVARLALRNQSFLARVIELEGAFDRIAVLMRCEPESNGDLIEAVRLLVAERDEARVARDQAQAAARAALTPLFQRAYEFLRVRDAMQADRDFLAAEQVRLIQEREALRLLVQERDAERDAARAEVERLRLLLDERGWR
jgi:hypothetical protein